MDAGAINKQLSQKKRPLFIWLIFISYIVSAIFTLLSYILITFNFVPVFVGSETISNSTTHADFIFELIISLLNLIGAIWLFQLKRKSFNIFIIVLILNLTASAYHMFKDTSFGFAGLGIIGEAIGWLTTIIIIYYIKKYIKEGVLI